MNSPALIRHLLLKDVRHQAPFLMLIWAYALLVPWTPGLYEIHNGTQYQSFYLLPLYALILIGVIRLVQLDPPGRGIHFLATRPLSWLALLASKAVFLVLLLLLPLLLTKLLAIGIMQVPFDFLDVIFFVIETVIFSAAFFAVIMLPSLFFRRLTSVLLLLVLVPPLVVFFTETQVHSVFSGAYYRDDLQLEACRWLMFYVGLALTAGATALVRYGGRHLISPLIIMIAGLSGSYALLLRWPVRLDQLISPETYAAASPSLKEKIHFHLENPRFSAYQVWKDHGLVMAVDAEVRLTGLEPPYYAVEAGFKAEAPDFSLSSTYDYGVAHATGMTPHSMNEDGANQESLREQIAGFSPYAPTRWDHYDFNAFAYPLGPRSPDFNWSGKTLHGTMTFDIRRMVVAGKVPVVPKTSFSLPRRRYDLEIPEMMQRQRGTYPPQGRPEINCLVTTKRVPLVLRGDYAAGGMQLSWLVVNRPANGLQGEYLVPGRGNFQEYFGPTPVFFDVTRTMAQLERPGKTDKEVFPPALIPNDWLDTAEIYIFDTESCGHVSFPYTLTGS